MTDQDKKKIETLVIYLSSDFGTCETLFNDADYLVLSENEANDQAKSYIIDSVWAFNADFLADTTGLPSAVFTGLQVEYEDANEDILNIIEKTCGIDFFIKVAIGVDGRGHFISSYDGKENMQGNFFVYQVN